MALLSITVGSYLLDTQATHDNGNDEHPATMWHYEWGELTDISLSSDVKLLLTHTYLQFVLVNVK